MDNRLDLSKYADHTPGPWQWTEYDTGLESNGCDVAFAFTLEVGDVTIEFNGTNEERDANKALLADAPALLSALKAAYAEIDRLSSGGWVKVKDAPPDWCGGDHCMILCENGERVWWSDMGYPSESEPGPGWFYELDRNYYERCDPEWRLFRVPCPPEEEVK